MAAPSPHQAAPPVLLFLLILSAVLAAARAANDTNGVTYDQRSLIINGKRELIFSGAIHYPRSTPEMWPSLIAKAKQGGLNGIETYVFWNIHEPVQGQYNFQGRFDLVKFIRLIQKQGMYAVIRIGPFVQGEWNYGGLPYWLREIPDILFRTNNEPFKYHMAKFVSFMVQKFKDEKLFAGQGGPIILLQIENEYFNIAHTYKEEGVKYIKWAAEFALGLNAGVPWVMCKQNYAPGAVINACNGRNCGETFHGPNHPTKPSLWTENWTAQYRVLGDPPSQRSAEDIAYAVTLFFINKKGSLVNYYMYHGGTNFDRTGAAFVTTRYYDEAPLDEYGLEKEPKYGHLRDLHSAMKLCKKAFLWGEPSIIPLGINLEARVYEKLDENICSAFLTNNNSKVHTTVKFRGVEYFLPGKSISILPDCKTVVYNTRRVVSQHNERTFTVPEESNKNNKWQMYKEPVPKFSDAPLRGAVPMELTNLTKDTTDYAWYITSFNVEQNDLPRRKDIRPVVRSTSHGHAMHVFMNGDFIGSGHGSKIEKAFTFQEPSSVKVGTNELAILGMTYGLQDSGGYLEHRVAGPRTVEIQGLNGGDIELTANDWAHKVGLLGEKLAVFTQEGSKKVQWSDAKPSAALTWYKRTFDAPNSNDPVALDLSKMGKGLVWINGNCIGRYWAAYFSPLGKPSQSLYHVPLSFLKPTNNLMVVFEELGGNPEDIVVQTVKRDNICTFVSESHPADVTSWARKNNVLVAEEDLTPKAKLTCPKNKVMKKVVFASFGNPEGACGNFTLGSCHTSAKAIAEKACLGKRSCSLPVNAAAYNADPKCPGTTGTLAVHVKCSKSKDVKSD